MEISDIDRATLEKYQKQARKVFDSKLIQSGFSLSMNINFNAQSGLAIEMSDVDEEQLKAVLVDFRPFISKRESVFIPRIFNLIERIKPKDEIINMEREIRSMRTRELQQGYIQIQHNGESFDDERMFDLILNSSYMHLDDEKSEKYESLTEHGKQLGRHQFLSYMYIEINTILNLANCIALILESEIV